jgi:3-hydroxybutyryl-CoA dehydratase
MRPTVRLEVGATAPPRRVGPISQTDIVRFAGAGGDFNPLHHDEAVAQAAGFDGVIAMGHFSAGMLAGLLSDWVGVENLRGLEVRFVAPLRIGDTVDLSGEVTAIDDEGAHIRLTASVDGGAFVTGTARVLST